MKGHLYFVGIVGHTMRGLALAARDLGYEVTGFDPGAEIGPATEWLADHHIEWSKLFDESRLTGVTAVIVTGAHVTPDSPVISAAKQRHIPIKSYAQLFGELTQGKHVIDVAGTHGKTTTSAILAWLLESAGRKPDYLIGIRPFNFATSVRLTDADIVVAEGDEYRASPLETKSKLQYHHPDVLILTAVEHDHPDFFADLDSVKQRFAQVIKALPEDGHLIACADSDTVMELASASPAPITTYGVGAGDYSARDITYLPTGLEFDIETSRGILGRVAVQLYGRHNVANTLAATVAAVGEGLSIKQIATGLATFKGTYRRFNVLTKPDARVSVVDDYAHHPTEVRAVIDASRRHFPGHRIVVLFRPHTYSRTHALLSEYHKALDSADLIYVTDIEGAREHDDHPQVSGLDIVQKLKKPALYSADRSHLLQRIVKDSRRGDVLLCLTVSGYHNVAEELASDLNKK